MAMRFELYSCSSPFKWNFWGKEGKTGLSKIVKDNGGVLTCSDIMGMKEVCANTYAASWPALSV